MNISSTVLISAINFISQTNLIAMCERELALSQLQLARGARKCRFPSIAQQHLDR